MNIRLASLHIYPVKSCRGITCDRARVTAAGLEHDREWMIVDDRGVFLTQREQPQLARVHVELLAGTLQVTCPGTGTFDVPLDAVGPLTTVNVWRSRVRAFDMGDVARDALSAFLGRPVRLVRFDPAERRLSNPEWTQGVEAPNRFSDGYPLLVLSTASLADLNSRLEIPLPLDRFRPNLVFDGWTAYGEDRAATLDCRNLKLALVKPCTRCIITTTEQGTGERLGVEPLATLRSYRLNRELRGVVFGQNAIVLAGPGTQLEPGAEFRVTERA